LKAHQPSYRLGGRQLRERRDLFRCAAEAGAFQKVRGGVVIPVGGSDRSEVVLPGAGRGSFGGERSGDHSDREQERPEDAERKRQFSAHGAISIQNISEHCFVRTVLWYARRDDGYSPPALILPLARPLLRSGSS